MLCVGQSPAPICLARYLIGTETPSRQSPIDGTYNSCLCSHVGVTEPAGQLSLEDRTALLADVRAQVEELSSLVGDLVELSRDDGPTTSEGVEPIDLSEMVDHAVERVRRRAKGLTFDVESPDLEGTIEKLGPMARMLKAILHDTANPTMLKDG